MWHPSRRALWLACAAAAGLRLAYGWLHRSGAAFGTWQDVDPDRYLAAARTLTSDGAWRWTFDAVAYYGAFVKAPLYPVALSLAGSAVLFHALLGALTAAGLFLVGRALHSERAGMIAAWAQALWLPSILAVPTFFQEHLAVPLTVAGLGLLLDGSRDDRGRGKLALAAVMLALAALTRAMPLYLMAATAVAAPWLMPDAAARRRTLVAMAAAFALTLPYSLAVSRARGEPIVVENIAFIHLAFNDPPHRAIAPPSGTAITALQAGRIFAAQAAADPPLMARRLAARARDLFRLPSTWWLPLMTIAHDEAGATRLKVAAHAWGDVPIAAAWLLAPLGVLLARRRRTAAIVALWIAATIAMTTATSLTGARYRATIEPLAIALAACVLAGDWRRASRPATLAALAATTAIAAAFSHFVPEMIAARSDVAVERWVDRPEDGTRSTRIVGRGAFSAMPDDGRVWIELRCVSAPATPVVAGVDGRRLASIEPSECVEGRRLDVPAGRSRPMRFEIDAAGVEVAVTLWDRRVETAIMARSNGAPPPASRGTQDFLLRIGGLHSLHGQYRRPASSTESFFGSRPRRAQPSRW